jgi:hypothetical protein
MQLLKVIKIIKSKDTITFENLFKFLNLKQMKARYYMLTRLYLIKDTQENWISIIKNKNQF